MCSFFLSLFWYWKWYPGPCLSLLGIRKRKDKLRLSYQVSVENGKYIGIQAPLWIFGLFSAHVGTWPVLPICSRALMAWPCKAMLDLEPQHMRLPMGGNHGPFIVCIFIYCWMPAATNGAFYFRETFRILGLRQEKILGWMKLRRDHFLMVMLNLAKLHPLVMLKNGS